MLLPPLLPQLRHAALYAWLHATGEACILPACLSKLVVGSSSPASPLPPLLRTFPVVNSPPQPSRAGGFSYSSKFQSNYLV